MTQRSHLMDGLRVVAAHVIVLHHLASYGPLAAALQQVWPTMSEVLFEYGRMATQVFLVMAGFLAGQMLLQPARRTLPQVLLRRYGRLAPPFVLALLCVTVVVWCLRPLIQQDWLTDEPNWFQFLAHVLLMQDILGQSSMTIGAWYVAIDFQLFVVLTVLCWALVRMTKPRASSVPAVDDRIGMTAWLVAGLCLASQWYFNRDPSWDAWAWYFFESYGLGVLVAWSRARPRVRWLMLVCLVSAVLAFVAYPRPRLLMSVVMALVLLFLADRWHPGRRLADRLQSASDASYGLFLSHFMVLVIANAVWMASGAEDARWGCVLWLLAWMACAWCGGIFHRSVETLMGKAWRFRA